eukprot:TRINITY_DN3541_c0_g1_i4.p1 TRINITY_DN3541_c0_g1~~TRINITY_DN3541_c0_g1_i4.p1  ORF type:complete len:1610 (-),score=331.44 TRINITY_DN3541_c0_g1_i4:39-4868(-)
MVAYAGSRQTSKLQAASQCVQSARLTPLEKGGWCGDYHGSRPLGGGLLPQMQSVVPLPQGMLSHEGVSQEDQFPLPVGLDDLPERYGGFHGGRAYLEPPKHDKVPSGRRSKNKARLQRQILEQLKDDVKRTIILPWETPESLPMASPVSCASTSASPTRRPLPGCRWLASTSREGMSPLPLLPPATVDACRGGHAAEGNAWAELGAAGVAALPFAPLPNGKIEGLVSNLTTQACRCGQLFSTGARFCMSCGLRRPQVCLCHDSETPAGFCSLCGKCGLPRPEATSELATVTPEACGCGYVFEGHDDSRFCRMCGARRGEASVDLMMSPNGDCQESVCIADSEDRTGSVVNLDALGDALGSRFSIDHFSDSDGVAAETLAETLWLTDQEVLEQNIQEEALDQTLSVHYVLVSAERDVAENALAMARMEARSNDALVSMTGQPRRKSLIPKTEGHGRAMLSFIPKVLRRSIAHGSVNFDQWRVLLESPVKSWYEPFLSKFKAALVFADASGFTKLTESLARQPQGAEKIGKTLNDFFGPVIEIVAKHGGDIIKFSGDALTIVWPSEEPAISTQFPKAMAAKFPDADVSATVAAARFCNEVQERIHEFGATPVPGCSLTMHIGVGFGDIGLLQVGGLLGRWEYCVAGPPLDQISLAEPMAQSGETVFSTEARQLISHAFEFEDCCDENHPGFAKLGREISVLHYTHPPWWEESQQGVETSMELRLVKRYVPSAVALRLASSAEADAVTYPEEMRRVSVVFCNIQGLDPFKATPACPDLDCSQDRMTQILMRLMQRAVYALEGSVNKFLVDDKGVLLLVAFGLPPLIHYTDDPVRAVLCGMRLNDTMTEWAVHGRIGVATGQCWCGVVGTPLRREYTVLGDVVNLSARLMGKAGSGGCLVDQETYDKAKNVLDFEDEGEIHLKGKAKPVRCFRFVQPKKGINRHRKDFRVSLLSWPGWPARVRLKKALDGLTHRSGVIFLTGPGGSGKTELAEQVRNWAAAHNWTMLHGQNMDPSGIFSLPRLSLQECFRQAVELASKDNYWRSTAWRLLMDSVDHGPSDELEAEMKAEIRKSRRLGQVPSYAEIYWMLVAMIRQSATAEEAVEMEPWAPLLSLVVTQLAFGPRMINAMLERDEQNPRVNRFAQLCGSVLDGFARINKAGQGTMVVLHIRRSSAFFQSSDKQEADAIKAFAEAAMKRRAEAQGQPEDNPLVLCVVSREFGLKDGVLPNMARECNAFIDCPDFDLQTSRQYVEHMFQESRMVMQIEMQADVEESRGPSAACSRKSTKQRSLGGERLSRRSSSIRGSTLLGQKVSHRLRLQSMCRDRQPSIFENLSGTLSSAEDLSPSRRRSEVDDSIRVAIRRASAASSMFTADGEAAEEFFSEQLVQSAGEIIADYVYEMTGGNALGIEVCMRELEASGTIKHDTAGNFVLAEPYMDGSWLRRKVSLPEELVGMAFSTFERLSPQAQMVLKAASTFDRIFSRDMLDCALSDMDADDRHTAIEKLLDPNAHALVVAEEASVRRNKQMIRFYSGLLRHASSTLVLETQRNEVHRKTVAHIDMLALLEAQASARLEEDEDDEESDDEEDDEEDDDDYAGDIPEEGEPEEDEEDEDS